MALALHHMPFGPAGTAREPCAQNLVRVLDALRRARRRGGPKKGFGQDRRSIHDAPHQRVQRRQGGLESIPRFFNGSCEAWDGTCPARTESCRRRFGAGPKKAEIASLGGWYEFEMP